jgi:methylamine methyltransferase corrinoid protein reductive activase
MNSSTPGFGSARGEAGLAVAMDLGTSGFRAQALDLVSGEVLSTAITTRHPLPGGNVIDHIHFALELGSDVARDLMIQAVNQVIAELHVDTASIRRLAVCGNPAQLSLLQGAEIRDLAYAGVRKLDALDVVAPRREAAIRPASEFPGLTLPAEACVIIPPAVRHEIGADALALILQTGMLERDETAIAIDYGTNAEMALFHRGRVFTCSAAAGPALEGQHTACGSLAMPGTIADLEPVGGRHRLIVLDANMRPVPGAVVDLRVAEEGEAAACAGPVAVKLTGTGTIAAIDQAIGAGAIQLPHIRTQDRRLHFGRRIFLTEADLAEAGKAIGAIRAGYFTLAVEAGITSAEISTAYLAGASGTYLDALKARRLGLIPPGVQTIRHVGNTSLALARALALAPEKLEALDTLAHRLRETHCMLASSKTFAQVFVLELSHWTEGMPLSMYRAFLQRYGLPDLPPPVGAPRVVHSVERDIDDLGRGGLVTLQHVGRRPTLAIEGCTSCRTCVDECPAGALSLEQDGRPPSLCLDHALCHGVACRRCERVCPERVFFLNAFFGAVPTAGVGAGSAVERS